jgi:hypothetical protein
MLRIVERLRDVSIVGSAIALACSDFDGVLRT